MTVFARHLPVRRACWLAPLLAALPTPLLAQQYGQPYSDPYRSGPTRPLDGSRRTGVYSATPAPSYEATRSNLGPSEPGYDAPSIWRGVYAGVHGAQRWSNTTAVDSGLPRLSTSGLQLGGHIGGNTQIGNFVVGAEADLTFGNASGATATSAGNSMTVHDSWTSTFRGRAGYAFGPALLYATGGVAVAGQDLTFRTTSVASTLTDTRFGLVFGAGVELKLAQQVSARIEGLRTTYRDQSLASVGIGQATRQDNSVIRAGISYHFN